jgi:hypothetical protein
MSDINGDGAKAPPLTRNLKDAEVNWIMETPLLFKHPCHNQAVERHIRLVSKAARTVTNFERRNGLIRQRIRSHQLIKVCETKHNSQQVSTTLP